MTHIHTVVVVQHNNKNGHNPVQHSNAEQTEQRHARRVQVAPRSVDQLRTALLYSSCTVLYVSKRILVRVLHLWLVINLPPAATLKTRAASQNLSTPSECPTPHYLKIIVNRNGATSSRALLILSTWWG